MSLILFLKRNGLLRLSVLRCQYLHLCDCRALFAPMFAHCRPLFAMSGRANIICTSATAELCLHLSLHMIGRCLQCLGGQTAVLCLHVGSSCSKMEIWFFENIHGKGPSGKTHSLRQGWFSRPPHGIWLQHLITLKCFFLFCGSFVILRVLREQELYVIASS